MILVTPIENLISYKSRDLITLKCKHCQETFKRPKHDIQKVLKGNLNLTLDYCSNNCSFNGRKKTIQTSCGKCQKLIETIPSKINGTKRKLSFCNMKCAAIYNNQHRILLKPNKTVYRNFALKNLPNECCVCGYNKYLSVLQVHHKDKNRKNNKLENLSLLCPTHHAEWHFLDKSGLYHLNKKTEHLN